MRICPGAREAEDRLEVVCDALHDGAGEEQYGDGDGVVSADDWRNQGQLYLGEEEGHCEYAWIQKSRLRFVNCPR